MLNDDVNQYVNLHRALGYKYRIQSGLLHNFCVYAEAKGDEVVYTQRVLDWARQAPSSAQRRNRLLTVRRFAYTMQAEDDRYQIPPADAFGRVAHKRGLPHIFTPAEITAILEATAQLTPKHSLRPVTYSTLFALMVATGLRSCEALALKLEDITTDGLIIRNTKFRKSRLVPLHKTTVKGLQQYLRLRHRTAGMETSVFVSLNGTALSYSTVVTVFLKVIRSIGLRSGPGHPGPRLHDLRHTFAVRSLEHCGSDSQAIRRHMSALSTYLGHAHVSDTYWYLQATPVLMTQIAQATETLHEEIQL